MSTILHGNKACARFEISISSHMRVGGKASEEIPQREKITLDPKTCLHSHEILLHQIASYLISVRCRLAPFFLTQFPFFGIISSSASKHFHSSTRCMRGKKKQEKLIRFFMDTVFSLVSLLIVTISIRSQRGNGNFYRRGLKRVQESWVMKFERIQWMHLRRKIVSCCCAAGSFNGQEIEYKERKDESSRSFFPFYLIKVSRLKFTTFLGFRFESKNSFFVVFCHSSVCCRTFWDKIFLWSCFQ